MFEFVLKRPAPVAMDGGGPARGFVRAACAGRLEGRGPSGSLKFAGRKQALPQLPVSLTHRGLTLTDQNQAPPQLLWAAANSPSRPAPVPARARASSPGSSEQVVRRWSSWPEPAYALVDGKSKRERARVKRARAGRARACIAFARIAAACRRRGSASVPRGCRIRPGPPPCVCARAQKCVCVSEPACVPA